MFGEYEAPKKPKLPTLLQFIKEQPKASKVFSQTFTVDTIWTPDRYDNFTLACHLFRIIIPDSHPLYDSLVDTIASDEGLNGVGCIGFNVTDRETGKFHLKNLTKKKGEWSKIGKNGWTWKPN